MLRKLIYPFYLFVLLLSWSGQHVQCQEPVVVERSNNKVVIEGNVYYVHVVKAGQTLYSVGRAYNVSVKEIMIENPGVTEELRIGQVLKIPSRPASAFEVDTRQEVADTNQHVVAPGETIYSISRQHAIAVEEIIEENPGIDIHNLQIGQRINIPLKTPENAFAFDEEGIILHKVKRRETLFSISRYYGVSVPEIRKLNPELGWGGPRTGDVLKIPAPNTTREQVFVSKVQPLPDTTPEIPQDTVYRTEPYHYEFPEEPYEVAERVFRIAYLVPFNYSETEPLDSLLKGIVSPIRRNRITEQYTLEQSRPGSVNFLEFIEGSLLAIDSLTDDGLKLDIYVYDTKRSMYQTRRILAQEEMQDMDLVFGPFYGFNVELVSEFCLQHRIPFITPFYSNDSLLQKNPYIFQMTPSYKTEYHMDAVYLARHYDKNLVFVHEGDSVNKQRMDYYKTALFNELKKYSALETVLFKEVIIRNGNTEELVHALNSDLQNIVIVPVTDEAFASQVATNLYYLRNDYAIRLFGSPYWLGFDDIQLNYVHALRLVVASTHFYQYEDPDYLAVLQAFQENYFREPSVATRRGCSYAIAGYDLTYYFLSALRDYGNRFILNITDYTTPGTICEFDFKQTYPSGGFENTRLEFYRYEEDLSVQRIDLPEQPPVHYYLLPAMDHIPLFFRQDSLSSGISRLP
jgi:LysM repeat protein/ABC-type branched-subunit amino acid transport system substrate-binding protein